MFRQNNAILKEQLCCHVGAIVKKKYKEVHFVGYSLHNV
jgi:hypothetical protein